MTEERRDRWIDLLVLGAFGLLSVAYLWPLVREFGAAMAGDGFDRYVFQWTNWWVRYALTRGLPLYQTDFLFYPVGADLHFLSFSWLNTLVWWPLETLIGDPAAYNFTVWWSWPLAGFGAYLLGREVFDDRRAALVSGLIYTFYPYHFAQRNHLNLLSIQWIPFSLLFIIRLTRGGGWVHGCAAGLFLALSGLSSWHLLTLNGMLAGLWLIYAWLREREEWSASTWRGLLALLITVALITGPFVTPLIMEQFVDPSGQESYLGKEGETQTDLVAHFLPNLYQPVWGAAAAPVHRRFLRNKDHAVSLGYLPLVLLVYGLWRWKREPRIRFWAIGLGIFWLLSLGPYPRINGEPFPTVPLPYRLVGWSFPVRSLRNPERFNILVSLCLSMSVGAALAHGLSRLTKHRAAAAAALLSALVLFEYWSWPFPTRPTRVPVGYDLIAGDETSGAIVDIPISNDLSKRYMYFQTVHERPTVTGHVSRPPAGAYAFIEGNDLLRSMREGRQPDPQGDAVGDLKALADVGVQYLIVHKSELGSGELDAIRAHIPVVPVHEDEEVAIYRTSTLADD